GVAGTSHHRNRHVDGLGASCRRARALCRHCPARRPVAPAIHHEKNGQGADLGICLRAYRARHPLAILGSAPGPSVTGSGVRLPTATKTLRDTLATKRIIGAPVLAV